MKSACVIAALSGAAAAAVTAYVLPRTQFGDKTADAPPPLPFAPEKSGATCAPLPGDAVAMWCDDEALQTMLRDHGVRVENTAKAHVIEFVEGQSRETTLAYALQRYSQLNATTPDMLRRLDKSWIPMHTDDTRCTSRPYVNSSSLLRSFKLSQELCMRMTTHIKDVFGRPDFIVSFETRAALFGVIVAQALQCGFVPARLADHVYGTRVVTNTVVNDSSYRNSARIALDSTAFGASSDVEDGCKVVIVDDVVSSGATLSTLVRLLQDIGGVSVLGCVTLVRFTDLETIEGVPFHTIM